MSENGDDPAPVITDNDSTNVHPDTSLSEITWKVTTTSSSWRSRRTKTTYTLSDKALAHLSDQGITVVGDLEGISETWLKTNVPGVGKVGAKRLIMAAKRADVRYRGVGYPFEIEASVRVPDDAVPVVSKFDEDEVREAFTDILEETDLGRKIKSIVIENRRQEIEEELEQLRELADDKKSRLDELERDLVSEETPAAKQEG